MHDEARAHADQRGRAQVAEGDPRPAGERAVRPQADHRVSGQQRGCFKLRRQVVAFQAVHQAQVGAAFKEAALDVGLQAADHLHLSRRVRAPEPHDGGCEQRPRGRAHRADPDHAGGLVLVVGRLAEPVHRVEHGQHVLEEIAPGLAEPGALPAALQQVHAKLALEAAHRLAQRGLGDVQRLGRLPVGAQPGDRGDVLQLFDPHDVGPRPG
jgi:hypothetical protein